VGPRPLLPVDQPEDDKTRLLVRPGLTGWAQVNGGRTLSVSDKTALDIWYVKNASLWLDMKILVQTVLFVLSGERSTAASTCQASVTGTAISPPRAKWRPAGSFLRRHGKNNAVEAGLVIEAPRQQWSVRQ
jgi:hypothetical protein